MCVCSRSDLLPFRSSPCQKPPMFKFTFKVVGWVGSSVQGDLLVCRCKCRQENINQKEHYRRAWVLCRWWCTVALSASVWPPWYMSIRWICLWVRSRAFACMCVCVCVPAHIYIYVYIWCCLIHRKWIVIGLKSENGQCEHTPPSPTTVRASLCVYVCVCDASKGGVETG